jgi:hypothetical protein
MHPIRPAQFCIPACLSSLGVLILLLAACQTGPTQKSAPENSAAQADALVPDYTAALHSQPGNYVAFLKTWFKDERAEIDSPQIVRYAFAADDKTADLAAEKLIFGNEAFCNQAGGKMSREEAGLTCIGAGGKIVSRLSVKVFHASAEQPGTLQFTGESAAWIARLNEKRLADYRRVIDTLSGNGIAGNVLLSTGESFDVVRFGRLSAPDFYALRTPEHGLGRPRPGAYGIAQGAPRQTSVTAPPVWRKSDFCWRASGSLRGALCGSVPTLGAVLVVGGVAAPLSHTISAEPSKGSLGTAGIPKYGFTSEWRPPAMAG